MRLAIAVYRLGFRDWGLVSRKFQPLNGLGCGVYGGEVVAIFRCGVCAGGHQRPNLGWGLGFRGKGSRFGVLGSGGGVWVEGWVGFLGSGFRVWGLGSRV